MMHDWILMACLMLLWETMPVSGKDIDDDIVNITNITMFPAGYNHTLRAGFLNVSIFNKAFYYILAESQNLNSPEQDPVILWLNGGPGCSSMMGFMTENGPFKFKQNSIEMYINEQSWNKHNNVLYLESPGGVGFSFASPAALVANDSSVAKDNLEALKIFFDRYRYLKGNDLYLAGESYAGIYIPRLAEEILNYNEENQDSRMNLRGILLGNACTHPTECFTPTYHSRYYVEYLFTRGFFEERDYNQYKATCANELAAACISVQASLHQKFLATGANIYNVYGKCFAHPKPPKIQNMADRYDLSEHGLQHPLNCSDSIGSQTLFNRNQFREALKIGELNDTLLWTPCTDDLKYTVEARAAYSTLPALVKAGLKITYFSGDHDAIVPIQGTMAWFQMYREEYGSAIKRSWRPWVTKGKGVSGMFWEIEGITFVSVIGAGHMVPTDKPEEAEQILEVFLGNREWTEPDHYID